MRNSAHLILTDTRFSDMIPIPSVASTTGTSVYCSDIDRESSRQTLDMLDRRTEADPDSKYLSQLLRDVSSQISPAATTE